MSKLSDIVADPPRSRRPKVTSVKVKTKGGIDSDIVEESTIAYYTEGENYSDYVESLSTILGISIAYGDHSPVNIPVESFSQTIEPDQGFEEPIDSEKVISLQNLGSGIHDVLVTITYSTDPTEEHFTVPMTFSA